MNSSDDDCFGLAVDDDDVRAGTGSRGDVVAESDVGSLSNRGGESAPDPAERASRRRAREAGAGGSRGL